MNIKGVSSTLILFSLILCCSSVIAKTVEIQNSVQTFDGILGDQDQYHFDVAPNQAISISIEQINADVKVALADVVNGEEIEIYQLSTPADTWLNELLYITAEDCSQCIVKVLPRETIDNSGKYQLIFERRDTIDPIEKAIMEMATKAGIAWLDALNDYKNFDTLIKETLKFNEKAFELGESHPNTNLVARYKYFAAQSAHYDSNHTLQRQYLDNLNNIIQELSPALAIRVKLQLRLFEIGKVSNQDIKPKLISLQPSILQQKENLLQAYLWLQLGKLAEEQGIYGESIEYMEDSLAQFIEYGDWRNTILLMTELGWLYINQGKHELALNQFFQALALSKTLDHQRLITELNTHIAYSYRISGEINLANHYINTALRTSKNYPYTVIDGRANQEKARIHLLMGQLELATDFFEEAHQSYKQVDAKNDMINIEYFLSIIYSQLENYQEALAYAKNVLEHDLLAENNYDIGTAYNRLANIHIGLGDYPEALKTQELALEYLAKTESPITLNQAFSQAAEIHFLNQNNAKSEEYFAKSRSYLQGTNNLFGKLDTDYRYAKTLYSRGHIALALESLQELTSETLQHQHSITRGDLKRSYLGLQQKIASLYIDALLASGSNPEITLKTAELFRAQIVNASQAPANLTTLHSQQLTHKRQELNRKLQTKVVDYARLTKAAERLALAKQTRLLANQIQELEAPPTQVTTEQSDTPKPKEINLNAIQQSLSSEEIIFYFDLAANQSHLWTISDSNITHYLLPKEKYANEAILKLIPKISDPTKAKSKRATAKLEIAQLSSILLKPLDIDWSRFNRVTIIPDGLLHDIPFSLLKVGPQQQSLVELAAISYLPSLKEYIRLNQFKTHLTAQDNLLLIANPLMGSEPKPSPKEIALTRGGFDAGALPYSQHEADVIEQIFANNSTTLFSRDASKQQLLTQPLDKYQIIHFATHGISYSHTPSLAGLVLSNSDSSDNLLLAPEIRQLSVPANLVVLSGCKTATGKLIKGTGNMGLSRAFFEAGAKGVVASLWSVQDKATAELMKRFYMYMVNHNLPISSALQKAKLDIKNYRKKNGHQPWKHPFYWAGFVHQGTI
ncbi:MAG: CHAT domain-containing tetratricopeptide repeat protein [Paraglaciecola sp.]|uniref:CHAT domain-containing protein n=1 Tax=Paraglaciecola sp. TaxID=1920173 RepID=UPI003299E41D